MIIILSVIGSILYRLGGMGVKDMKEDYPFLPKFFANKLTRRLGLPLLTIAYMSRYGISWWIHLIAFVLMYAAMTTYLSETFAPADDVNGTEWALTGLFYSLSVIPYCFVVGFSGFFARCIILTFLIWAVSYYSDDADVEEYSRGFLFIITLGLL